MLPRLSILLCALVGLAACTSTNFQTFDDGGRARIGSGGARETADGVDIWSAGSPPRPYHILGLVTDTRRDTPLMRLGFKSAVVAAVRKNGGDAAIIVDKNRSFVGTYYTPGSSTTYRTGNAATTYHTPGVAVAVSDQITTFAVIKYLAE